MSNNDTNTLNGALRELGETMADNLTTMGVTSTYDEGLSTLASKILTIHLEASLSSDTDVLSYADSSSAVLTATVLEAGSALTGETVNFYKYVDGTNDVLLGSDVTDSNGEASYTYASAGIGDFEVYAKVRGIESESCSIEDCNFFDPSSSNNVSKYSVDTGASFSYDSANTAYSIYPTSSGSRFVTLNNGTFNKDNKVSIDFKLTSVPDNGQCGFVFGNVGVRAIIVPNSSIRRITISDASLNTDYSLFEYSSLTLDTWYTLELLPTGVLNLKQNDTIVATCNYDISSLLTDNNQFKLFVAYNYRTRTHVKNIKIKPL